jgi:hypothetical protein
MNKLHELRDSSDMVYNVETQLLQSMAVIESLHIWARLQNAFEWQLQRSAPEFEQVHREYLTDLQSKLAKIAE